MTGEAQRGATTAEVERRRPAGGARALRRAIYDGRLFLLDPTLASRKLVEAAWELVGEHLGGDQARRAHELMSDEEIFARVGTIRRILFEEERFGRLVSDVVEALGFDPERVAVDPLRLRVIAHRGHENPRAAAVYYAHRDTWYAHPQGLITWWIPLDDLEAQETFVFYPDWFARPVPNDSEVFDYGAWLRDERGLRIGWQDRDAGLEARYPQLTEEVDPGLELGFGCSRAQNLLFSGAHFHQTLRQSTGQTRYSLDFRLVDLDDHAAGLGAPNVDNRSRGSALSAYARLSR